VSLFCWYIGEHCPKEVGKGNISPKAVPKLKLASPATAFSFFSICCSWKPMRTVCLPMSEPGYRSSCGRGCALPRMDPAEKPVKPVMPTAERRP